MAGQWLGAARIQGRGWGTGMSGVAVNRGTGASACHAGIDHAVIKLNAVNIDCPNRSKQEGETPS